MLTRALCGGAERRDARGVIGRRIDINQYKTRWRSVGSSVSSFLCVTDDHEHKTWKRTDEHFTYTVYLHIENVLLLFWHSFLLSDAISKSYLIMVT